MNENETFRKNLEDYIKKNYSKPGISIESDERYKSFMEEAEIIWKKGKRLSNADKSKLLTKAKAFVYSL